MVKAAIEPSMFATQLNIMRCGRLSPNANHTQGGKDKSLLCARENGAEDLSRSPEKSRLFSYQPVHQSIYTAGFQVKHAYSGSASQRVEKRGSRCSKCNGTQ